MGRKRSTKIQMSLFREKDEAHDLLRTVEQLRTVRATVVEYKRGSFGVKIKDACITDRLPKVEAEEFAAHLNRSMDMYTLTIAQKASEFVNSIVLNIREEVGGPSQAEHKVADHTETGTEDQQ